MFAFELFSLVEDFLHGNKVHHQKTYNRVVKDVIFAFKHIALACNIYFPIEHTQIINNKRLLWWYVLFAARAAQSRDDPIIHYFAEDKHYAVDYQDPNDHKSLVCLKKLTDYRFTNRRFIQLFRVPLQDCAVLAK